MGNKRIVLIGAGSAQFGTETVADILQSKTLAGGTVVLHDINPVSLGKVAAIAKRAVSENNLPFKIEATTSRKQALKDADFCIISIEVGSRFDLWEQDWLIPRKYGSRQIFGENGGPGGLFHSLRIIPPIIEICKDIDRLCPDAFVFNYSNPMSRICLAATRRFPKMRFVGLCHEIFSLPHHLPRMLGTPFSNLSIKAGGLNHFSVLLEVKYKDSGKDAYPDVRRKAMRYFRGMPERGLFREIFRKFGLLPITTDSHFGEYIQWADAVADHEGIRDFYTRYKKMCLAKSAWLDGIYRGKSNLDWWKHGSGERMIPMMEGIVRDSGQKELAVNVPNDGFIDNLPRDLVVEVPGVVTKNGVRGVRLGALPKGFAGLLNNQSTVQDLTVEAALTGSRAIALQALLVDPVVDCPKSAEKMLAEILKRQRKYLGYLK